ncbi:hypothetical protein [Carnobacterium divergens]|uniref:Phage protein, HK97 gp10 family n=1 Tax=Carnobacterium divergens TaxID=2748 RepID=A0AAW8R9N9_CARDV|nr:hypothetical protein [Carnobacterium divergens]MDT1957574.1 hypothetical protein [Carnobacterium divergens]MDT1973777.1 hypothetical protein [Carnobacterium divergens]MDT2011120.1 hypothetical protein [Carnobacterium divergens]
MVKYQLDMASAAEIETAMKLVPEKAEKLVNQVLHTKGTKEVIQSIIGFIPVSRRNKKHARFSNPLKSQNFNLGFEVYAKGGAAKNKNSFGYLVFPDEGRGSHNPVAQMFFERGTDRVNERILNDVIEALGEAIEL